MTGCQMAPPPQIRHGRSLDAPPQAVYEFLYVSGLETAGQMQGNSGTAVTVRSGPRRRPTQADVARLAAVSQPVVSYVLSGEPGGCRGRGNPTAGARCHRATWLRARTTRREACAARRTCTIAGVIPDITNPFYPAFERGIQDVAEAAGYDLITYNTDGKLEKERKFLRSALAGRVDGVIVTPFHLPGGMRRTRRRRAWPSSPSPASRRSTGAAARHVGHRQRRRGERLPSRT